MFSFVTPVSHAPRIIPTPTPRMLPPALHSQRPQPGILNFQKQWALRPTRSRCTYISTCIHTYMGYGRQTSVRLDGEGCAVWVDECLCVKVRVLHYTVSRLSLRSTVFVSDEQRRFYAVATAKSVPTLTNVIANALVCVCSRVLVAYGHSRVLIMYGHLHILVACGHVQVCTST